MGKYFGDKLRSRRMTLGLSGNRLAQASGISQSNLNGIELGRRPPSDRNLQDLAKVEALGLTYDELKSWASRDKVENVKEKVGLFTEIAASSKAAESKAMRLWAERQELLSKPDADERRTALQAIEDQFRKAAREAWANDPFDEEYVDAVEREWLKWMRKLSFAQRQALFKLSPDELEGRL